MTRRKRRNHSPGFKSQVAIAAMKRDKTLAELSQQFDIHPNQITDWKTQRMERSAQVFGDTAAKAVEPDIRTMQAKIGRKRGSRLMKKIGIEALYRKPNLSRRHAAHPIYPYLLRNLTIDRPNQAQSTDITYIPMKKGLVYLAAIVDWHSRKVLSWRVSNTLTADFCIDALNEAIARHGRPELFNTDQGSQFTSLEFTQVLKDNKIAISMDGKGCWRDNIFVERLWRSVKYEEVYLKAYDSVSAAKTSLGIYFNFYNTRRPHQSLDGKTPDTIYFAGLPQERIVA